MRKYYTEYVAHCVRFYVRHQERPAHFKSPADCNNWYAVKDTLLTLHPEDRIRICEIYSGGDTIPDNIYQYSRRTEIPQDYLWKLVDDFERRVAKKRGLL